MTKWQKDYLHVPADAHLTSDDYICRMGFPRNYKPGLNDLIGPHENRTMNLMRMGHKPIALISEYETRYWKDEAETQGYHHESFLLRFQPLGKVETRHLYYYPGQEWRVRRLIRCYRSRERQGFWTPIEQARVGFLLGYTKQCIRAFLIRTELIYGGDLEGANAPHLNFIT